MQDGWGLVIPVLFFTINFVAESLPSHSIDNIFLVKAVLSHYFLVPDLIPTDQRSWKQQVGHYLQGLENGGWLSCQLLSHSLKLPKLFCLKH